LDVEYEIPPKMFYVYLISGILWRVALFHKFFDKTGGWRHRLVGYIGTLSVMALFFSGVSVQIDALIDAKEKLIGNIDEHRLSMTLPSNLSLASKDVCIMGCSHNQQRQTGRTTEKKGKKDCLIFASSRTWSTSFSYIIFANETARLLLPALPRTHVLTCGTSICILHNPTAPCSRCCVCWWALLLGSCFTLHERPIPYIYV